jgi:hypothetical protein
MDATDGMGATDGTSVAGETDDEPAAGAMRSVLPWPSPVRSGPGRWTLIVSCLLVVGLAIAAVAIVVISM